MSDQDKFLSLLTLKQQQNAINIINCLFANNDFLNLLQRRRSELMRKLIFLRKKQLTLFRLSQNLQTRIRLCWTKTRAQTFWEIDCAVNGDDFFKNNFRMSRSSFDALCRLLQPLEKQDTNLRKAIPLQKRVAIALYALGSPEKYRFIGNKFGVGKSTVCQILLEFCTGAWKCLQPMYMANFPLTRDKIEHFVQGFQALGCPQCMGAVGSCHIEIHPAPQDAIDYFNYKGWYSTVLLALVDAGHRFIHIDVGSPGSRNDSQIFDASTMKQQLDQCTLLSTMTETISEVNVPIFIVGDSTFHLSRNLMKPYAFNIMQSEKEKIFNHTLSKCQRVVEDAFGQLKARFFRIGKGIENIKNASTLIKACCVLHNFLNEKNDTFNETWMHALQDLERYRQQPKQELLECNNENSAESIRNALGAHFSSFEEACAAGNGDGDAADGDAADSAKITGPSAYMESDIESLFSTI